MLDRAWFEAVDNLWLAHVINNSRWWFPVIETIHVLGFSMLMGATFLVDMHFFGISMQKQSVQRIARQLWPWSLFGLTVTAITGILMFISEAIKCYENAAFLPKMVFFFTALVFQMTLHKRLTMNEDAMPSPAMGKLAGMLSVFLWSATFAAGRAIGFV